MSYAEPTPDDLERLSKPSASASGGSQKPGSNVQMYWLNGTDLDTALRELADELGLAITDESLTKLDADLEGTWYGSTYIDGRHVPGTWATLRHGAESPQFELAEEECGGVFIRMSCDDAVRRRAVEVLARFNPLNRTPG